MALELAAPVSTTTTYDEIEIIAFSVNMQLGSILVDYLTKLNTVVVGADTAILDEDEFMGTIALAGSIAGVDVFPPIKTALYQKIEAERGISGTVI